MSLFLGANTGFGGSGVLTPTDEQAVARSMSYQWDGRADQVSLWVWQPGVLWSGSGFCGMAGGGTFGLCADDSSGLHGAWDVVLRYSGGQQALKLRGTTRDSAGNPLANANVEGFVTSTNVSIGIVQSDASGYFELPCSAGAVHHYLVAYKPGSPDVAGTTVNTLTPTT